MRRTSGGGGGVFTVAGERQLHLELLAVAGAALLLQIRRKLVEATAASRSAWQHTVSVKFLCSQHDL